MAVAIGLGAALLAGPATALADPSDESGSNSSATGSTESSSETSSAGAPDRTAKSTSATAQRQSKSRPHRGADAEQSAKATSASPEHRLVNRRGAREQLPAAPQTADVLDAADVAPPSVTQPTNNSAPPRSASRTVRGPDKTARMVTEPKPKRTPAAVSVQVVDEPQRATGGGAPPTAAGSVGVPKPPAAVRHELTLPVVSATPARQDPVESVTAAISDVVNAVFNPFAGTAPTAPVDSPLSWTLLAAARRELFGQPPVSPVADVVTTTAVPTAASTATGETVPAPVAVEQTPPLAFLQQIPVIGPALVTPVVAAIHQIPILSDIIHPVVGYPLQQGLPAGTPVPRDVMLTSFDGTQIYVHFMPAAGLQQGQRAPTILFGPGLGMPGATNIDGTLVDVGLTDLLGSVSVGTLRHAGYNVVTWDPRGEYFSGGQLEIDHPDVEARDVSAIISWVATQPEVRLDSASALDPRMGMVGVSYGGGIQLVTAATDHRVDAIVPTIAWHSLNSSLNKAGAAKTSWGLLLTVALVLTGADFNPQILTAVINGALNGELSPADRDFLAERSPAELIGNITAPTLLIQGTVDTLFSLQEADAMAAALLANGVPTKVVWFCGGHGLCLNNPNDYADAAVVEQRTLQWLDRYVKGDASQPTGARFEWVDQHGQWFSSNVYPVAKGDPIVASSSTPGTLPLVPIIGGSGFPLIPFGSEAINAVNLTTSEASTTTYIVGSPNVALTYSGTGSTRYVYAHLVDDATGHVLGGQVTPIPVTLDGRTHTVTVALEPVAATLTPGQTVTLQLVAEAGTYQEIGPTLGELGSFGVLNVSSIKLTLPTAEAAAIASTSEPQTASVA